MSTAAGRVAEDAAAHYLRGLSYDILQQNWRTRYCEIDLVAQLSDVIYFVEVKYRARDTWGTGLDYITPQKLRQMQFAAELWLARTPAQLDYRLAAIELHGVPPRVGHWLDDIGG